MCSFLCSSCILIFDSLGGERAKVVEILRGYLSCKFQVKLNDPSISFKETNMKSYHVDAPRQLNLFDCGVFALQFVEEFFKDPAVILSSPEASHVDWFHQDVVTRKREKIGKKMLIEP
jgi:Ulp1 family protease